MNPTKEQLTSTYKSKDTDELINLYNAGSLTDDAYQIIEFVLKERHVSIPKRSEISYEEAHKSRNHYREFIQGKKSLTSTFWMVGILGNIGLLILVLIYIGSLKPSVMLGPIIGYIAYDRFMLISLWRSSKKTKLRSIKLFLFLVTIFPIIIYLQFLTISFSALLTSRM